jgi:hypothetical protein
LPLGSPVDLISSSQIITGKWQSPDHISLENFIRLKSLLVQAVQLTSLFKGDGDALWITLPLLQLVTEILYTLSFYLIGTPSPPQNSLNSPLVPSSPLSGKPMLLSPFIQITATEDPYNNLSLTRSSQRLDVDTQANPNKYVEFLLSTRTDSWNKWKHSLGSSVTLTCTFNAPFHLKEYRLESAENEMLCDPSLFVLKGLDAQSGKWVELHRVTECPFQSRNEWATFPLLTGTGDGGLYLGAKLVIESSRKPSEGVQIRHFHLHGVQPTESHQASLSSSPSRGKQGLKIEKKTKGRLHKTLSDTSGSIEPNNSSPSVFPSPLQLSQQDKDELSKILCDLELTLTSSSKTAHQSPKRHVWCSELHRVACAFSLSLFVSLVHQSMICSTNYISFVST